MNHILVPVLLVLGLQGCTARAQVSKPHYYRVMKPPVDVQGVLSQSDTPQPTDEIVIIDCIGRKLPPFRRSDGYRWQQLPQDPCLRPIIYGPQVEEQLKQLGLILGTNTQIYLGTNHQLAVVTTKISASNKLMLQQLGALSSTKVNLESFGQDAYLDVTYQLRKSGYKFDLHVANPNQKWIPLGESKLERRAGSDRWERDLGLSR